MNQMLKESNMWHYWMMVRPNKRKKPKKYGENQKLVG
jgi:hypothetical protein